MSVIMKGDTGNPNPLAIPIAFCEVLFSLEDEEEFLKKYPQKHHLLRGSYFLEIENGKKNANFMINEYGKHGFKCSEYLPIH